jgi:hypothetical protein
VAVAALMDSILSDAAVRDAVLDSQERALDRLLAEDFAGTLIAHVERALAAPRRRHDVVFDFWQQVDTHERLKALKKVRPALYEALPEAGGRRTGARGQVPGTRHQP